MAAWRHSFQDGARHMAPVGLFVVPFGIAYGAAAIETGLAPWVAMLKSGLMFAGASQIAALEIWHEPLPVVTLILVTLAVNARHILLGATLAHRLLPLPPWRLNASLYFLTDANWAVLNGREGERITHLPAFLCGSGLVLWVTWVIGTWIGVEVGRELGDLKRYGLDLMMVIYFGAVVMTQWRGRIDLGPWIAAAVVGVAGSYVLPMGWHVIAGALAGGLVGAWQATPPDPKAPSAPEAAP
jgi:4-azaleucine resistance transporter AzlC